MGCNTCRSACEDCSEGGVTFRRVVRLVVPAVEAAPSSSLDSVRGVAELGSDPNSAKRFGLVEERIPELGSDPNSAGHRDQSFHEFYASSPYEKRAGSYLIDNNRLFDPISGSCAETRRMGVRAQFGDAAETNSNSVSRIGIRPPFCCAAQVAKSDWLPLRCDAPDVEAAA